jgi:lysozyme family protein
MWKKSLAFGYACCLLLAVQAALPAGEQWYLIRESELRSIEDYRKNSEAEKQAWLLQVQRLRTRAGNLETESVSLNSQLAGQREQNRKLTLSFSEYEAAQLTRLSLKDGEIAELKLGNKAVAGQRNIAVIAASALGLAWVLYTAFKICRFLKIIPV